MRPQPQPLRLQLLRLQTLAEAPEEAPEEAPGQTLEQTLTERENARSSECFGRREEKRAPQESMPQPSSPDDRSDNSTNERNKEERNKDERNEDERSEKPNTPSKRDGLPFFDPPGTDHRPRMTRKGDTFFPRKLWGLLRDGEITSSEFTALIFLLDQTDGWPVLHRMWVRLTNRQWADALGMTPRGAHKVRHSLLEKGLMRRKKDGRTYLYQIRLPERDREQLRARRHAQRVLGDLYGKDRDEGSR